MSVLRCESIGVPFGCYTVEQMLATPSPRSAFLIALEGIHANTGNLDYDGWDDYHLSAIKGWMDSIMEEWMDGWMDGNMEG